MKQLFLILPLVALLTFSCKREQAVWESDWQVPLLDDTLNLNKLVEDSIVTVNGGYYELSIDRTIYELKLSDIVDIPDTTIKNDYAIPINGLNVSPGTSFVNNVEEHVIDMGDIELKRIRVKSGGVSISVKSPIETTCLFTVQLPGVTKNGVTLTQDFTVPPGSDNNLSVVNGFVDMAGYELDLRGASQGSFNRIQSKMTVKSDPNGQTVNVSNLDTLRFVFTMNDLEIDYARGYFGSQLITDTISENIEALSKISSGIIDLPSSSIELELVNGLKMSAKAKLTQLANVNAQQNTVNMTHPTMDSWITINSASGTENSLQSTTTTLLFDGSNSNVEQYLENHGAKNDIGFELQLNPWGNVSGGWDEIFPQSSLKVNLKADMPLAIGLNEVVLLDTFDFSFKQDFTKTHIISGNLWVKATNAFPLSGVVTLYLLDASGNTITTINGSTTFSSSVFGSVVNGILQKQSFVEFPIAESVLEQLDLVKQLSLKVTMNTPDPATNISEQMAIPADAFFGIKVGAKLKVEAKV
ncbi:MAG: hypothetical protein A3D31_00310 [Candidatus Fluviicola riflensis]|nr:MAG: hypothetical protein CHH17_05235 [Candidatus Fluviicola riflensis]OGS76051.1 MAG: hypothetical protein A3D31_00310 [Candidatus Fluviicola riflensis]OGS81951.1 MAG: hypothetical protein A2724_16065 [Fluviicola sp. RIFCSPHIGHO2_01_FULL_43_53]OGS83389.1 MAG: hypothetical protein A3E30_19230 [Fluviicola sp. RIFCSPHIGHO2_12_FULL_43_24]